MNSLGLASVSPLVVVASEPPIMARKCLPNPSGFLEEGNDDKMIKEIMTNDEKANNDKLDFYYQEKVKVHIVLKRKLKSGKNSWLNGFIIDKLIISLLNIKTYKSVF